MLTTFLTLLVIGCPADNERKPCAGLDDDSDGVPQCHDCNDDDPTIYPGATEVCDGKDTNCDDVMHPDEEDTDGDGLPDCWACEEGGYWQTAQQDLAPSELTQRLIELSDGVDCGYQNSKFFMFVRLDKHDGEVQCVYTGRTTTVAEEPPDALDMNAEHTWPQSEGANRLPAKCDLHHLYPTDADANNARANHPFGEVLTPSWQEGGSQRGSDATGEVVFEPRVEHQGNVARSMLYFALRYERDLPDEYVELFLKWHEEDTVDASEIDRSLRIQDFQGTSNPFVVCPSVTSQVAGQL